MKHWTEEHMDEMDKLKARIIELDRRVFELETEAMGHSYIEGMVHDARAEVATLRAQVDALTKERDDHGRTSIIRAEIQDAAPMAPDLIKFLSEKIMEADAEWPKRGGFRASVLLHAATEAVKEYRDGFSTTLDKAVAAIKDAEKRAWDDPQPSEPDKMAEYIAEKDRRTMEGHARNMEDEKPAAPKCGECKAIAEGVLPAPCIRCGEPAPSEKGKESK